MNNKLIFIFDTETTGLPYTNDYTNLEKYNNSRLIQFSGILYDFSKYMLIEEFDIYIKPDEFKINNSHIHNITDEIANKKGIPIKQFFKILKKILKYKPLKIVGHNVDFDNNIIKSELYRYKKEKLLKKFSELDNFCTMKKCVNITKIKSSRGYKYPKLCELYKYIFGHEPKKLHNSLYDARYTLECVKELYNYDLIKLF